MIGHGNHSPWDRFLMMTNDRLKLKGQSPCAEMENKNQRIAAAVDTARFEGTNGSRSPLTV